MATSTAATTPTTTTTIGAAVILQAAFESVCSVCKKSSNFHCGRCKTAHYCSQQCQRAHWNKYHKKLCIPITSPENAMLFVKSCRDLINQEEIEPEKIYWFGSLVKTLPYLLKFITKEQINFMFNQSESQFRELISIMLKSV